MKDIVELILNCKTLQDKPPVLVDIGASGEPHKRWSWIAPFASCVAFDADERDLVISEKDGYYKHLFIVPAIVSESSQEYREFFLAKSPHCSSVLPPHVDGVSQFLFSSNFIIDKQITLKNTTLTSALARLNIDYIDWFKSDSQGIDLRLFNSISPDIKEKILFAEFEPGFVDAYKGEDKLYDVLRSLELQGYDIMDFFVHSSPRITRQALNDVGDDVLAISGCEFPICAELLYLNSKWQNFEARELLLMLAFCLQEQKYGVALEIFAIAKDRKWDEPFERIETILLSKLTTLKKRLKIKNMVKRILRIR